ncbi:unnamed protein product [Boreogadus saida]
MNHRPPQSFPRRWNLDPYKTPAAFLPPARTMLLSIPCWCYLVAPRPGPARIRAERKPFPLRRPALSPTNAYSGVARSQAFSAPTRTSGNEAKVWWGCLHALALPALIKGSVLVLEERPALILLTPCTLWFNGYTAAKQPPARLPSSVPSRENVTIQGDQNPPSTTLRGGLWLGCSRCSSREMFQTVGASPAPFDGDQAGHSFIFTSSSPFAAARLLRV